MRAKLSLIAILIAITTAASCRGATGPQDCASRIWFDSTTWVESKPTNHADTIRTTPLRWGHVPYGCEAVYDSILGAMARDSIAKSNRAKTVALPLRTT